MEKHLLARRDVLRIAGASAALGLAGCLSNDQNPDARQNIPTPQDDGDDTHHEHEHDHQDEHQHTIGEPEDSITVDMVTNQEGQHYLPHLVHITEGGTVTWRLESGSHDVNAYHSDNDRPMRMPEKAQPWSSGLMTNEGATYRHTFEHEGVYDYYCQPHETVGMVGRVIVGNPDLHEQHAMQPPRDSVPGRAASIMEELNSRVEEALGDGHSDTHDEAHNDTSTDEHVEDGHDDSHNDTHTDDPH